MHRLHVMATMRLAHAALRNLTARNQRRHYQRLVRRRLCAPARQHQLLRHQGLDQLFYRGRLSGTQDRRIARARAGALPGIYLYGIPRRVGDQADFISSAWWMPAEDVVEASLRGLEKGKLFVVPGWRYKLLVLAMRMLPRGVLHFALTRGPASLRRERQKK